MLSTSQTPRERFLDDDAHAEIALLRGVIAGLLVRMALEAREHDETVGELLDALGYPSDDPREMLA